MSYEAYKLLHVIGIFLLFAALGGLAALRATPGPERPGSSRLFNMLHGVALLVVLVAGFGLLSRLEMATPGTWPTWVWIKLGVWILLGAGLVILKKAGTVSGVVLLLLVLLGAVAAGSAIFKP